MTKQDSKPAAEADSGSHANLLADLSLFGVAAIWGINIPLMKIGLEQVDQYVFNAIRLGVSALVLAYFALRERARGVRPATDLPLWKVIGYALVVGAVYQLMFLLGIARTTAGNTALIISTVPMWTALLARFLLGERLQRMAWFGLLVALIGTIIVALQKGDVSVGYEHLIGNGIVLGAALMWSAGTVFSRPMLRKISPMQLAAAAVVFSWPIHAVVAIGNYQESLPALSSPTLWLIILFSGVLSSGLAQPMWNFGVRLAGAAHAAIIQNAIPLIAIIAAWLSRGERPTSSQLIGGALILGGLLMMRMSRRPDAKPPAPPSEPAAKPVARPRETVEV